MRSRPNEVGRSETPGVAMDDIVAAGLAETIRALRDELTAAMAEGADKDLLFELGDVQLEFQVVVSRAASTDGGVRFGVISFGAKGQLANEATHKVCLTMRPVTTDAAGRRRPAHIRDSTWQEPR